MVARRDKKLGNTAMKAGITAKNGYVVFTLIDEDAENKTSIRMTSDQTTQLISKLERARALANLQAKLRRRRKVPRK